MKPFFLVLFILFLSACSNNKPANETNIASEENQQSEMVDYLNRSTNETTSTQEVNFLEKGQEITQNAQKLLGKNLMQALNSKGTEYALDFCSEKAIPLTNSSSTKYQVHLKRVSDKNRNPMNTANEDELNYILSAKQQLKEGKVPEGQMKLINNKHVGYYPIVTNAMCLQCHGTPNKEIKPITLTNLQKLYPEDKAKGYEANELRGIWVIEMD